MSTTSRILLGFLLFLAAGLYLFQQTLAERVEREYTEATEEAMVDMAQVAAALFEQHADGTGSLDLAMIRRAWSAAHARSFSAKIYGVTKTTLDLNAYVTDRAGKVIFDSDNGRREGQDFSVKRDVWITLAGRYGARASLDDPTDKQTSVMYVAAPIRQDTDILGVVSIYKPVSSLFRFRDETRLWIRSASLIFFCAVTIGAYLVVTLFSRPIRGLTSYALAVARGERVLPPMRGSPETLMLGQAFEQMRDALEDRAYVTNYVQALTHEMKSPVAAIRGAAELLHEAMPESRRLNFLGNIEAESRRLQNIIDRLLALSALESRKALEHPAPIALAELLATVCDQLRPAAESRGLSLELDCAVRPRIEGESFMLENALNNILQNAIDFSPENGRITIRVLQHNMQVDVVVEDEGPGIPGYALARVFERFYSLQRPGGGRKSSGLGLCFATEIAALHGGSMTLVNRSPAPGAKATFRLPNAVGRAGGF